MVDKTNIPYLLIALRVGGIVGSNEPDGTIENSVVSATLTADHAVSAKRVFLGLLDIGGVSGVNSGKIDRCLVNENATITACTNGEERVGGISGTNDGDGIIKSSYTKAAFAVGNRSKTEKTYWGGAVGLNNAAVTYCYAVIGSDSMRDIGFAKTEDNGSVGGLFGKGAVSSSALNSFAVIECTGPNVVKIVSALGSHEGATLMNCYTHMTASADGFATNDGATYCDTEEDLLVAIDKLGYESMGYTVIAGEFPTIAKIGNQ